MAKDKTFIPIKNWPFDERPREKLLKHGSENLTNCELLAIMLRTGIVERKGSKSAVDLAKNLLNEYENLNNLMNSSIAELSRIKGIGNAKAAQILASIELGKRAVSEKNGTDIKFKCSEEVAGFYIPLMKDLKKEQFKEIMLDVKNKLIREILISQGSLTASLIRLATQLFTGRAKSLARLVQLFFSGKVKSMAHLV